MKRQKKVAAIHDISCMGKCSLTTALPILSAAGISTSVIPTAVLSTHTGGFTGYTYRDLTEDIPKISRHWQSLGLSFDGIYTGFLGSYEQLRMVIDFIGAFKTPDTIICVDPAMADFGKLYPTFSPTFPAGMVNLCSRADIIVPNMTEAALLLGREYSEPPYSEAFVSDTMRELSESGPKQVVLTGIQADSANIGCAYYDRITGESGFAFSEYYPGRYHGTGDIFASVLCGSLVNGFSLAASAKIASKFTSGCIKRTYEAGTDTRFGVNFEDGLAEYAVIMNNGILD